MGGFVEEEGVVGVSAEGGDGDGADGDAWRWYLGDGDVVECGLAVGIEEEANFVVGGGVEMALVVFEEGCEVRRAEGEIEIFGGGLQASEVLREEEVLAVPEEGFDELEILLGAGEELQFEKAFGIFLIGDGVVGDAAADAQLAGRVLQNDGADGNAENGVAVGREKADGAGIDAARG